jgi:hypothetical protein
LFSAGVLGQTDQGSVRNSLGLRGGYPVSAGDWNKVRYLPDVNMFKPGFMFGGDLEFRLSDRLNLALEGGYESLDGGDWETYTRATGDTLSVGASFGYASVLLRPCLKSGGPDILRVEIGPVVMFPSGHETFDGRTYNDDFFGSIKVGGEGGIEYDRMIGENLAASLSVAGIVVPSGIAYADGESRAVIAVPVTLGLRFYY